MIENGRYIPDARARWALLGAALVLGWISARAAIQNAFEDDSPQVAAQAWPADGPSLAGLARQHVAAASGDIDDSTRALYQAALAREPLLADPLALAGLDAANSGNIARAEQLMLAARARDPRSSIVRFWLFDHFVRTGNYALALDEVAPAIRLRPDAITAIMTVLAAIATTPDGMTALAEKLAQQPYWGPAFFQTAANGTSPQALLALLQRLPNAKRAMDEQRAVFLALVNAGDGARAYQAWRGFLPMAYQARVGGIYDGNFGGWPGAQPFNWMLTSDATGTTQMVSAGDLPQATALDVHYFGSTSSMLAEQYVYATPGAYRLQLAARRRTTAATGGRLNVALSCLNGDVLATVPLDPLDMQLRAFSAPVTIPAGCDLLRVRVIGTPGEMFSEVEAQITSIALVAGS